MDKDKIIKNIQDFIARKEVISIVLIGVFIAVAILTMYMSPQIYQRSVHEGDIALKDIYAPYDFSYDWGVDEERTGAARDKIAAAIPYSVKKDTSTEKASFEAFERFFDTLKVERSAEAGIGEKVADLKASVGEGLSDYDIRVMLEYEDTDALKEKATKALAAFLAGGYMSSSEKETLKSRASGKVYIFDEETEGSVFVEADTIVDQGNVKAAAERASAEQFPSDKKIRGAVADMIVAYAVPNMVIDAERTEAQIQEAIESVEPVYNTWSVKKNELIIEKGIRVNAEHIAQFAQMRSMFRPGTTPTFFVGVVMLSLLLLLVGVVHTVYTAKKPQFLKETKKISVVLLNMLILIVIADFVMNQPQPSYFIPLAGMGMLVTLLVGFNAGFLSVVVMGLLISLLMAGSIGVFFVLLVGSVAGMIAIRDVRRRARILWAGLIVGAAKALAIVAVGLINGIAYDVLFKDAAWGVASGILSGFMVMGLLPFFEHVFKIPTNISLLELSDLNHPLLKKLAMEASGTYHHSIMVGNLAEAACDSIGANSLLARVGAYYHDIGKIPKAEYFSENEMGAGSKHSKLAPSMSALIISKHVKEGAEIAKQYKLNNEIIDFISQHHGNSLIAYFYQKALEKAGDPAKLKEENFRYPGPRPQTKERAIVLLADAVEASSRALTDPTPASIRNLVKKIVNNKFIDGQLDECDLTLRDMHNIAESFERVLMGIFHVRVPYPEENKRTNGTSSNENKDKQPKPKQKKKD